MKTIHMLALIPLLLTPALAFGLRASDASAAPACRAAIDDPEPVTCPLCSGNAETHVRILFAIERALTRVHLEILR